MIALEKATTIFPGRQGRGSSAGPTL